MTNHAPNQIARICRLHSVFADKMLVSPRSQHLKIIKPRRKIRHLQTRAPSKDSDQRGHPRNPLSESPLGTVLENQGFHVSSGGQWRLIRLRRRAGWSEFSPGAQSPKVHFPHIAAQFVFSWVDCRHVTICLGEISAQGSESVVQKKILSALWTTKYLRTSRQTQTSVKRGQNL